MLGTSNPTFQGFDDPARWDQEALTTRKHMTVNGTVTATGILVGLCASTAVIAWKPLVALANEGRFGPLIGITAGGMILGLVLYLIMMFAKRTSPFLAPVYAIAQGAFLTGASISIAARFLGPDQTTGAAVSAESTGLIFQAVLLTFGVLFGLLFAYRAGLVRIGGTMAKVLFGIMGAVMLYVAALWIGNGMFGAGIPNLFDSTSPLGIGFSVVMIALGCFMLILDFQYIEAGAQNKLPKHMEWFAGVGLLVTLVWLYIEILRLLAKLRAND